MNEQGWRCIGNPCRWGRRGVTGNQDADRCSLATSKPCRFQRGTVGSCDVLATSKHGSLFGGEVEVVRTLAVKFPCHGVLSDHPATRRHRMGGGQRHQGAVGPSAGLWHPVKRRRSARERVELCPTVLCDHTEHPANREANHAASQGVPRQPLTSKVSGWNLIGHGPAFEKSAEGCRCGRPENEERLLTVFQAHGLQPWQGPPRVIEVSVGERQHVHIAGFERFTERPGFEPATLLGVACLEAFTGIDDGNAVGPFDEASADRTIGCWTSRSRTEHVNVQCHGAPLRIESGWGWEETTAGERCRRWHESSATARRGEWSPPPNARACPARRGGCSEVIPRQ